MKKSKLFLLLFLLTQHLLSQVFTEYPQSPPFVQVSFGSIAFADVNGDNHKDAFITGSDAQANQASKLYTNDGTGIFTEMVGTPFENVSHGSIAFADVNGNSHQDILITGRNDDNEEIAKLYINDGVGNFTEMIGTPFEEVRNSSVAFADVNGDNFPDVLISGQNINGFLTTLYTNDGTGVFTEITGTPFEDVALGSVAFADVNGDDFQDILISGLSLSLTSSKLYINDGAANFTELTGTPFEAISNSCAAFADVNGDNFPDILISGQSINGSSFNTKLYVNDGAANFTLMTGTPFENLGVGCIAFSDVNGNGHQDVLITGKDEDSEAIAKLFINDGIGNFTEMIGTPFLGVFTKGLAFADVNGDSYQDVIIAGLNGSSPSTKLYINDGTVNLNSDLSIESNLTFTTYPNPLKGNILYVNHKSDENIFLTIKVYDLNGQLLKQQKEFAKIGNQVFSINTDSLAQGTYFIELDNGKRKKVAKFLVD